MDGRVDRRLVMPVDDLCGSRPGDPKQILPAAEAESE